MVGVVGLGTRNPTRMNMETTCNALLKELENIWTEIGESETDKDRMMFELEKECLQVYRRKVDEASDTKSRLHQSVAAKEAELATLRAALGEHGHHAQTEKRLSLKEQLTSLTPLLDELKVKKAERLRQFTDIRTQIEKISGEIKGYGGGRSSDISNLIDMENNDLSLRKLSEYQMQLRTLQKEKSDRLHKVLECVNEVHRLCGILGMDFAKTVDEVHPSLHKTDPENSTNISDSTLEGLTVTIQKLKADRTARVQKLKDAMSSLSELWSIMDSSVEERRRFERIKYILGFPEMEIKEHGILSLQTIDETVAEVVRLTKLKASRMKELVLKKRSELEDVCRRAHIEPDNSTAPEKSIALIDSGIVDPSELLANIEEQILKANEEVLSRKEIMDRMVKWLAACEEEKWLEDYNQDDNRYNSGRGAHLNLKRAERARVAVTKIPAMVDALMNKTFAWEDEKHMPFLYDGVRLVSVLEEYKLTRQLKEEEKKRFRDRKKLQGLLLAEKEAIFGSKPSPTRSNSFGRRSNGYRANGILNGSMTPTPRRVSVGSATPELLTPRSYSGRQNGYFRETRRLSTAPINFVAISKEDTSSSFASISGSEPGSPPLG